jgi:acyl-CoA synthetase (AMP-forming)/AMP-acid ligase II
MPGRLQLTGVPPTPPDVHDRYAAAGLWDDTGLRDGVEHHARRTPAKVALADATSAWSYERLESQIARAAGCLSQHGISSGVPALLIAPLVAEAVVAYHAILRCGGIAVLLDRRCGQADVRHALDLVDVRLVISGPAAASRLRLTEAGPPVLSLDALGDWPVLRRDWPEPDPRDPCAVVFTSGTTSRPKGVVHSLNTLRSGARSIAAALELSQHDAAFLSTPLASITGLVQLHLTLDRGARLILEDHFDAAASLERLRSQRATVLGGAPVIIEELFRQAAGDGIRTLPLRAMCLGGTMIPRPVLEYAIERFGITPVRIYGSSEAPCATGTGPSDRDEVRVADDGVPAQGVELRTDGPVPGELLVRGPMRFLGYLSAADNREAFAEGGWLRTGDLGVLDRGRLTITGRVKEIVARKGMKISLAEVDEAVLALPGVEEAATYGVPDSQTGERLVLAVRCSDPAAEFDVIAGRLLAGGLAKWKLPEQVVFWDEPLPRTASGKIQRHALADGGRGRPAGLAPRLRNQQPAGDQPRDQDLPG